MSATDQNIQEINKFIKTLKRKFTPDKNLMSPIASEMFNSVDANFENQGRDVPGGWAALSPKTIMQKKRKGLDKRILFGKGNLHLKNQPGSDDNSAWVSNNTRYAAVQHFGHTFHFDAHTQVLNFRKYKKGPNAGKVRFSKESNATFSQKVKMAARSVTIPPRPFMVLTDPFKNLIIEEIRKHVAA